jgi:hypothetical protein
MELLLPAVRMLELIAISRIQLAREPTPHAALLQVRRRRRCGDRKLAVSCISDNMICSASLSALRAEEDERDKASRLPHHGISQIYY